MTDVTLLPPPAARILTEQRRSTQASLNDYFSSIEFQFESQAFARLCNTFFERPWDGIQYLPLPTNAASEPAKENVNSNATEETSANTVLDQEKQKLSTTIKAKQQEESNQKKINDISDQQIDWPLSASLVPPTRLSDIFHVASLQTTWYTNLQLRSEACQPVTNPEEESPVDGLRFLSALRKKLAQGFDAIGTITDSIQSQNFTITVESLQPGMVLVAKVRGSIRSSYSGCSSLMRDCDQSEAAPDNLTRGSIILDNSTNTMNCLELVPASSVCTAMRRIGGTQAYESQCGIILIASSKIKPGVSRRDGGECLKIATNDLEDGIFLHTVRVSLAKINVSMRDAFVSAEGKCISIAELKFGRSNVTPEHQINPFILLASTGMISIWTIIEVEVNEHKLVPQSRVYCGSIYPVSFEMDKRTLLSAALIPAFEGAIIYGESESICTLIASIGRSDGTSSSTSQCSAGIRHYFALFSILGPSELGGVNDWRSLPVKHSDVHSSSLDMLVTKIEEKSALELVQLMNLTAGLAMKIEYCQIIRELLFKRMDSVDQRSNLCDFFVGSFLSDWKGQECSDAPLLGRDYMCVGWSNVLLKNMGLQFEEILLSLFTIRIGWNDSLVTLLRFLLEQYSSTTDVELVSQVESRRIEEQICNVVETHQLVNIAKGETADPSSQDVILQTRLYLTLIDTLLSFIIYKYHKITKNGST